MNTRCSFCQTPYTLSRVEMLDALQEMDSKKLNHYDAHCPRCRRATPVTRQRMEMFLPNWREALKEYEAEMKAHPPQAAPAPAATPEPAPAAGSAPKPDASPKPAAKTDAKGTGDSKPAARKSPGKSSARSRKTTAKKTK